MGRSVAVEWRDMALRGMASWRGLVWCGVAWEWRGVVTFPVGWHQSTEITCRAPTEHIKSSHIDRWFSNTESNLSFSTPEQMRGRFHR